MLVWWITRNLREDQYTFLIVSCSVFLRMRNVSDKGLQKITTHILSSMSFFLSCLLWDNVKKILCNRTGHRQKCGAIALYAGYLRQQIHTLRIRDTYYFSTTTVVAQTAPPCYVQWLSCSIPLLGKMRASNRSLSVTGNSRSSSYLSTQTTRLGVFSISWI